LFIDVILNRYRTCAWFFVREHILIHVTSTPSVPLFWWISLNFVVCICFLFLLYWCICFSSYLSKNRLSTIDQSKDSTGFLHSMVLIYRQFAVVGQHMFSLNVVWPCRKPFLSQSFNYQYIGGTGPL
jgi:hypothetical protein